MTDIRIDAPGAGQWVMDRAGGVFMPVYDHSFTRHDRRDGSIRGGFVLCQYLGASMAVHCAGDDKHWCNRELLWVVFYYAFVQLNCIKLFAPLRSDDDRKMAMWLRAGWALETVLTDAYALGVHMMVLTMVKDACPWLNYQPKEWRVGHKEAA
jgi:hypothetical protein